MNQYTKSHFSQNPDLKMTIGLFKIWVSLWIPPDKICQKWRYKATYWTKLKTNKRRARKERRRKRKSRTELRVRNRSIKAWISLCRKKSWICKLRQVTWRICLTRHQISQLTWNKKTNRLKKSNKHPRVCLIPCHVQLSKPKSKILIHRMYKKINYLLFRRKIQPKNLMKMFKF